MSRRGVRERKAFATNLTPMIDVTFLLIVFFVLVSQIVEVEQVAMDLPEPTNAATDEMTEERRVVLNVVPGLRGAAREYRLGGRGFAADAAGVEALAARLASLYATNPGLVVHLRADRGTDYEDVAPAMQAITVAAGRAGAEAGIEIVPRVNLVVRRGETTP